ncbi:hypothetical protein CEXT_606061 [Caerostris extrusa]|uniref:Uncharacterized protein n=1 Tax=Caerostris extrusa TaxID=172846 RepID=A0AAV4PXB9_CAEEX|nr:hypothetical protein CEXT_606061 [Caerostris extrusa]
MVELRHCVCPFFHSSALCIEFNALEYDEALEKKMSFFPFAEARAAGPNGSDLEIESTQRVNHATDEGRSFSKYNPAQWTLLLFPLPKSHFQNCPTGQDAQLTVPQFLKFF